MESSDIDRSGRKFMVQIVDMLSEDWASLPYLNSAFVNLKIYGLEETPICSAGTTS